MEDKSARSCYCLVVIDHHWLGVTRLHCCVPGLQCSLIQKIFDSCSCTTHNEVSQSSGEISQMFIIKYLVKWISCILLILDQILIKSSVISVEHVVNPPRLNFSRNPKSENYLRNNKQCDPLPAPLPLINLRFRWVFTLVHTARINKSHCGTSWLSTSDSSAQRSWLKTRTR